MIKRCQSGEILVRQEADGDHVRSKILDRGDLLWTDGASTPVVTLRLARCFDVIRGIVQR